MTSDGGKIAELRRDIDSLARAVDMQRESINILNGQIDTLMTCIENTNGTMRNISDAVSAMASVNK